MILREINFKDLFNTTALPVLNILMMDKFSELPDMRAKVFNVESADREISQVSALNSLGDFQQLNDAEQSPLDEASQSYNKTYRMLKYSKSIAITKEMIRDEKLSLVQKAVASLARSAHNTQQKLAFNILNGAFSSSLTPAYDGVALISASHTSPIGNQSNTLAAQSDLATTSLKEAETVFRKTKDQRGKQLDLRPSMLVVAPDNAHNARELVMSPFLPGSANNNINSLGKFDVIDSPFLTDVDGWFLVAAPQDHGMRVFVRQPLETESDMDKRAGVLYYIADYREAYGADEWRGIVGSDGSAS